VRVVSGEARGRRLKATLPSSVRPTTDRVKESIFDILGSLGGVVDLDVVDLFCGSGALGIEALSRGARSVIFVDSDPAALAAARENLKAVGLESKAATFVRASLPGWTGRPVDLVLADPPYSMEGVGDVLASIDAEMVVLESRDAPEVPVGWSHLRERRYGTTLVTVLARENTEDPTA
jgi:16S rRNA (guanine966-N2)-methyltransferase